MWPCHLHLSHGHFQIRLPKYKVPPQHHAGKTALGITKSKSESKSESKSKSNCAFACKAHASCLMVFQLFSGCGAVSRAFLDNREYICLRTTISFGFTYRVRLAEWLIKLIAFILKEKAIPMKHGSNLTELLQGLLTHAEVIDLAALGKSL